MIQRKISKIRLIVILSVLLSLIRVLSAQVISPYVFFLPLSFLSLFPIYENLLKKDKQNIYSISVIVSMYWLRMVVLPVISYCTNEISYNDYSLPLFLTIYEYIFVSLFVYILYLRSEKHVKFKRTNITLQGSGKVYLVFFLLILAFYLVYARRLGIFEFLFKNIGNLERSGDIVTTQLVLIRQLLTSGLFFGLFYFFNLLKKNYQKTNKKKFLYISLILALFFVGIITGERRSSIIYKAFSVGWLLINIYPYYRKKITKNIAFMLLFVLVTMTIYKSFNAFMYDSYYEAVSNKAGVKVMKDALYDSYFFGIRTIDKNIAFDNLGNLSIKNIIFDFFRSIFGLHYFLKSDYTTVQLYNFHLYGGEQTSGFLFSSVAYGYNYLGFVLSPLVTLFNVLLLFGLEKRMRTCTSIEFTFLYSYVFARYGFGLFSEPSSLINMTTQVLFINGAIYLFARTLKKIRR